MTFDQSGQSAIVDGHFKQNLNYKRAIRITHSILTRTWYRSLFGKHNIITVPSSIFSLVMINFIRKYTGLVYLSLVTVTEYNISYSNLMTRKLCGSFNKI